MITDTNAERLRKAHADFERLRGRALGLSHSRIQQIVNSPRATVPR